MHIQTHVLSGWCVANLLDLAPRERALAMVAATAADLDGLGLLVSLEAYGEYHHVLAHNILFGLFLSALLTVFSPHRVKAFLLYLALFHLHLVLDLFGSGPGWGVCYLWPFRDTEFRTRQAWAFVSWQNFLAVCVFLSWTIVIVVRKGRTPLEAIWPSLDRKIVQRYSRSARP